MKVHSKLGPKEVLDPEGGESFVTDENDDVEVPTELARALLEQPDAWVRAKGAKADDKKDGES